MIIVPTLAEEGCRPDQRLGSLDDAVVRLSGAGVEIELGPVPRNGALGPMTSVYFRDPDANLVEVSVYS